MAEAAHNGGHMRILIAEDDPDLRALIRALIRSSAIARYFDNRFDDDVVVLQKPFSNEELLDAVGWNDER